MSVLGPLALMTVELTFATPRPPRSPFRPIRAAIRGLQRAAARATEESALRGIPTIRNYPY